MACRCETKIRMFPFSNMMKQSLIESVFKGKIYLGSSVLETLNLVLVNQPCYSVHIYLSPSALETLNLMLLYQQCYSMHHIIFAKSKP